MVSDNWPPDSPTSDPRETRQNSDTRETRHRYSSVLGELWQDWFETLSDVAYQTHKACDVLAKNGPSNSKADPFGNPPSSDPVDMDKLAKCLQSLDPKQAARVIYAVQAMQAMEGLLERRRARADGPRRSVW
jgi:hypothetical protein